MNRMVSPVYWWLRFRYGNLAPCLYREYLRQRSIRAKLSYFCGMPLWLIWLIWLLAMIIVYGLLAATGANLVLVLV